MIPTKPTEEYFGYWVDFENTDNPKKIFEDNQKYLEEIEKKGQLNIIKGVKIHINKKLSDFLTTVCAEDLKYACWEYVANELTQEEIAEFVQDLINEDAIIPKVSFYNTNDT